MRFLQVGLGSMGKRRIRCLKKLGFNDIFAFDISAERRNEVKEEYGIAIIDNLKQADFAGVSAMIISTPPDKHDEYIELAIKMKIPAFVEASVVIGQLEKFARNAKKEKVLIVPSCTLKYHPAIKKITSIVKSNFYGKVTNFTYHSGQYLPDWHPYENVKDFYVSKKETGAAKEIVTFELAWITGMVGFPVEIKGFNAKTMDLGVNIDDTYVIAMEFKNKVYGIINVDAVSRYATRSLILNLEYGQILWRWEENMVKLYDAKKQSWITHRYNQGRAAKGYNKNISEDMYVEELGAFIKAICKKRKFPNTLKEDIALLKMLKNLESSNG